MERFILVDGGGSESKLEQIKEIVERDFYNNNAIIPRIGGWLVLLQNRVYTEYEFNQIAAGVEEKLEAL